jgi:hypothetical protein
LKNVISSKYEFEIKITASHLVHHLLSAYALGATDQQLEKINASYHYLEPKPRQKYHITAKNWTERLGDEE